MKIALILSGQFRDAKKSYESIKKYILDPYSPDIFISTWVNPSQIVPSGWFGETPNDDCSVDEIAEMYNPKSIVMETFDTNEGGFFHREAKKLDINLEEGTETKTTNVFAMWYKKHSANQLKIKWEEQNNFKYDVVVLSRFDLCFLEEPIIEILPPNKIKIPVGFDWCGGIGDLFAYGDSITMDKYFQIFEKMKEYRLEDNISPTPELIHKHHIEKSRIELARWILKYQIRGVNVWEK